MFFSEIQVIDNLKIPQEKDNSKLFNHIQSIKESYSKELNFADPQSMNFQIKLNDVYIEWQKSIFKDEPESVKKST